MKKLVLIIAILVTPLMSFAQGGLFDKYEDMEGVGSGVVNSKMFQMISSIEIDMDDPEAAAMFEMIKKIKSLKFLTTGDKSISTQMSFKDGNQTVKFYVREGANSNEVKELLMFVNGLKELTKDSDISINGEKREIETVIVSLLGDINLKEISKITKSMNIPGGEHLKKAGDKKN